MKEHLQGLSTIVNIIDLLSEAVLTKNFKKKHGIEKRFMSRQFWKRGFYIFWVAEQS